MLKLADYIVNGKGIGARFMLLLAFLLALQTTWYVRKIGLEFIPQAQVISDQFLPIKIENATVVEPQNSLKNIYIPFRENKGIRLQLDTTRDTLDSQQLQNGLYLSRRAFYSVSGADIRIRQLSDNLIIKKKDYRDFFRKVVNGAAFFTLLVGCFLLFLLYLLLTLAYNLVLIPAALIGNQRYDFNQRMRLSALAVTSAILLRQIGLMLGFALSLPALLLLVIALQGCLLLLLKHK